MEIDVLAVNETDVVLVHYRNYNAYGAVAGIQIDAQFDIRIVDLGRFQVSGCRFQGVF